MISTESERQSEDRRRNRKQSLEEMLAMVGISDRYDLTCIVHTFTLR